MALDKKGRWTINGSSVLLDLDRKLFGQDTTRQKMIMSNANMMEK